MTALGTTTSEHETAALGAGTNEETVRADTLDLGGLIGTLGSHDESLPSVNSFKKRFRPSVMGGRQNLVNTGPKGRQRASSGRMQVISEGRRRTPGLAKTRYYTPFDTLLSTPNRLKTKDFFIFPVGGPFRRLILFFFISFTQLLVDNVENLRKNNLRRHLVKRRLQAKISQL